jgi:stage II sporulation protein D
MVASVPAGGAWRAESQGGAVRVSSGVASRTVRGTLRAVPTGDAVLRVDGRRYRGVVELVPTDSGLVLVNRLGLEDYLRGVVPREIGPRTAAEAAAVEAQAIAARSYAFVRLRETAARPWDVVGGVLNQVYGGADAETPVADAAVVATAGMVLWYRGAVINAPFHAACGGRTAAAPELWRTAGEPFLQAVDDTDPATGRPYCERSPRFRWTVTIAAAALRQLAARWLATYGGAPAGDLGPVTDVRVAARTPTGRAMTTEVSTSRGTWRVRANDIRFVLRTASGELLNSTQFDIRASPRDGGDLVLEGHGHGHGVGMCQWGAIGRARSGFDARAILRTYFPGTTVAPAPAGRGS